MSICFHAPIYVEKSAKIFQISGQQSEATFKDISNKQIAILFNARNSFLIKKPRILVKQTERNFDVYSLGYLDGAATYELV